MDTFTITLLCCVMSCLIGVYLGAGVGVSVTLYFAGRDLIANDVVVISQQPRPVNYQPSPETIALRKDAPISVNPLEEYINQMRGTL
jgi:hypothetical protein